MPGRWGSNQAGQYALMPHHSNYHYSPHSHAGLTTHLVVDGELTLWYPDEADREKKTYGPGARIDVDAGRVHEVWIGKDGCTYVIGE
jgi:quercetin dioxygenase-like cupin family protein